MICFQCWRNCDKIFNLIFLLPALLFFPSTSFPSTSFPTTSFLSASFPLTSSLWNINQPSRLNNESRLILTRIERYNLEGQLLGRDHDKELKIISHIPLTSVKENCFSYSPENSCRCGYVSQWQLINCKASCWTPWAWISAFRCFVMGSCTLHCHEWLMFQGWPCCFQSRVEAKQRNSSLQLGIRAILHLQKPFTSSVILRIIAVSCTSSSRVRVLGFLLRSFRILKTSSMMYCTWVPKLGCIIRRVCGHDVQSEVLHPQPQPQEMMKTNQIVTKLTELLIPSNLKR